jgi:hypothetical protein
MLTIKKPIGIMVKSAMISPARNNSKEVPLSEPQPITQITAKINFKMKYHLKLIAPYSKGLIPYIRNHIKGRISFPYRISLPMLTVRILFVYNPKYKQTFLLEVVDLEQT